MNDLILDNARWFWNRLNQLIGKPISDITIFDDIISITFIEITDDGYHDNVENFTEEIPLDVFFSDMSRKVWHKERDKIRKIIADRELEAKQRVEDMKTYTRLKEKYNL